MIDISSWYMQVIYLSHFEPFPVGHGGMHRAYQVLHDLEKAVGQGHVTLVMVGLQWWKPPASQDSGRPAPRPWVEIVRRNSRRLLDPSLYAHKASRVTESLERAVKKAATSIGQYAENPYKLLANTDYTTHSCSSPRFLAEYRTTVDQVRPAVCVIEHTSFADVIPFNKERGILTICCPENLEAFDLMNQGSRWSIHSAAVDFANEMRVLADCDERLFISQVETAMVSGLGIDSRYYPYVPTGEIRAQHELIREERINVQPDPGLFVMLGSAKHPTTREGLVWFLQQAAAGGLPDGVRVIVAGSNTETLLPDGQTVPGIEIRGWVDQSELNELLLRAHSVLIPQRRGFGALTRIPELACAGIPVITSRHPTYALDLPPGARVAEDNWDDWRKLMISVIAGSPRVTTDDYARWEERQARTLSSVMNEITRGGG